MTSEFWHWWQHIPEHLDPVLIEIGFFKLQYYGLMYLVAFGLTYLLVLYRIRHERGFSITAAQVESLTTAMIVGVILGGRLGYVLFYNLAYYARHPLEIFLPFSFSGGIHFTGISGMSYHGGLIGVIVAAVVYGRRSGIGFREIADLYAPAVPLGYTFGRIGNFINGELYGRVTDLPVGMIFPAAPTPELRHPSQLYEAFFEGIVCFLVLWLARKRIQTRGAMLALYLVSYGTVRFFVEFFRQPDAHLGFVLFRFSAGQLLCALMILAGGGFYLFLKKAGPRNMDNQSFRGIL
jgi:phosphatidylglycerol:prolipoprotein diacylglycerol transferase